MKRYLLLLLAASSFTQAATFNVSTTPELRNALTTAATNGEDDIIIIADGTYKTTDDDEGTFIYFSNESNALTLIGSSSENVILSGNSTHQVFSHNSTEDAPLKLEKLSVLDGNASESGGGVYTDYSIDVIDCDFSNNTTTIFGGGFYVDSGNDFESTSVTKVTNSTFTDNTAQGSGGFYTFSTLETSVVNSTFTNNTVSSDNAGFYARVVRVVNTVFKNNQATFGGGGFGSRNAIVENSTFLSNSAVSGDTASRNGSSGGFYSFYTAHVKTSRFENNIADTYNNQHTSISEAAGGFVTKQAIVENVTFKNNSSSCEKESNGRLSCAGAFIASQDVSVKNSIFTGNIVSVNSVDIISIGAVVSSTLDISNSLFNLNSSGVYIESGEDNIISNSIFIDNNNSDINGGLDVIILNMNNNYIDTSNVSVSNFESNNIFGVNLGFVDEVNGDYSLTEFSELIDAGTTNIAGLDLPIIDINGNNRIVGGGIDIGPYEFSTTRPTIHSFTYSGIAKEQSELSFSTDYTLADGRDVNDISYDFMNDGNYTALNIYTYNTAGTYTIGVKVTDNEGEFSTTTTSVTIAELPFSEMTYEQKLIKAIAPEYYESLLVEIDLEKSDSFNLGKQYVQDNLSEFSLVTEAAQTIAVATATSTGIASGENNVINNPVAYGLNIVVGLSKEGIAQLPTGWKMISIPEDITDLSVFDGAKIVWFFSNETQAWTGYSSNSNTVQQMKDKNIAVITSLSAGDGIFIEM